MSSEIIRKFMDLLNGASKPTQLNESEELNEAPNESWVGRRTADYFAAELNDDNSISTPYWWLATIVADNGTHVRIKYDNDKLNDPSVYELTSSKYRYAGTRAIKMGQVLLKGNVPFNPEGQTLDEIRPLVDQLDYMRPTAASKKAPKFDEPGAPSKKVVNAATPPKGPSVLSTTAPGTFKLTPRDMADLEEYARQGDRIMADGKAIYAGFGNRSGLHSYLSTVLDQAFAKWPRAKAKLEAGAFNSLEVLTFKNVNRDRGNWMRVQTFKNAAVGESIIGEETDKERAAATAAYQKEREIQRMIYDKSGKSHGEGFNDPQQMLTSFKVRYKEGFVQKNSAILGAEAATTLWDKEGSGAKVVGVWVPGMKYGFMV